MSEMDFLENKGVDYSDSIDRIKGQEKKYYYHLLFDCISGKDLSSNINEVFEVADLSFANPFFKVALICCEGTCRERIEGTRQAVNMRLVTSGISFISFYDESGKLIYIANLKTPRDISCDHIFYEQASNSGLKLNCGISTLMEGVHMLRKLFIQADAALKESMFRGARVCRYVEINKYSRVVVNIGDYIKLLDLFNRGMRDEVHKLIEDIFIKLTNTMPNVKDTVSTLFNLLSYLYINLSMIYRDICDIEEVRTNLAGANSMFGLKLIVMQTIDAMYTRCSEENRKDYSNHIINYMINEVRTRYHTKITLYDLAYKLAVNYNYLSGLFAKKTGMTFQEYLLCIRLDKARELLLNGKHRMNDIAGKCGFYDSKHFGKAFRKRFNIAPGEYRDQF